MNKTIKNIGNLISFLPSRDLGYGDKFFKARDFESLKEIVDSALVKTLKNIRKCEPLQEYLDVDIDKLHFLKAEVDIYNLQLNLPTIEEYYYGDNENSFWQD